MAQPEPRGQVFNDQVVTDTVVNELCPWSGDPVQSDSLGSYRGHIVGFCNPGCRDKFLKATRMFDDGIAQSVNTG